ncbi:MAG: NAD(P)H-dependent oxidoreductase [Treponema sp.]|jgi:NAD(P)H dehydrogenase (quinone)|nr:NAD(P)H-dependent oxidoreductase [Treponema sp.]
MRQSVFIVYAHPGENSFTAGVRDSFIRGLESSGIGFTLSDLYRMDFRTDLSEAEYRREAFYRRDLPVPEDVAAEQAKIDAADGIAFIYPLFWSDVPAKLKGWFDRVWTYGFAYGEAGNAASSGRTMKQLEKGIVLCCAGNTMDYFRKTGLLEAQKRIMLQDRLFDRVGEKELVIFDGTSREMASREALRDVHMDRAFRAGEHFFSR